MAIFITVVVVVVLFGIILAAVRATRRTPTAPVTRPATVVEDGRAVVTLDLGDVDPDEAGVRRLVDDAARRVFATLPDIDEVEVRNRTGAVLGRRRREALRDVAIPGALYEPHAPRHAGPDVRSSLTKQAGSGVRAGVGAAPEEGSVPARPLADRFEMPEAVRARLTDPDDPVDLVRAILEASGRSAAVEGEVVRTDGEAVIVVRVPVGELVDGEALNHAFRRFGSTGAASGVVITPGFLDPQEVRRREALAPHLAHAGPDGIQRMCDAVAAGGDPLRFAAGPSFHPGH